MSPPLSCQAGAAPSFRWAGLVPRRQVCRACARLPQLLWALAARAGLPGRVSRGHIPRSPSVPAAYPRLGRDRGRSRCWCPDDGLRRGTAAAAALIIGRSRPARRCACGGQRRAGSDRESL
eukprot:scaffold45_cov368-Prasinococcus_capsulatus_cf.AAC.6